MFLIFSDLVNFAENVSYHYSLLKGFYVAQGMSKHIKTFYVTSGNTSKYNDVDLINYKEIDDDFIDKINYILIGRESIFKDIIEKVPSFKNLLLKENRKQLIGIKSDSSVWISSYNSISKKLKNMKMFDFILKYIDIVYVQNKIFKIREKHLYEKNGKSILNKIFISPMGIPNLLPKKIDDNPYDINHSYCVSEFTKLKSGLALFPLCYTKKNRNYLQKKFQKNFDNFNKKKTIIVYIGRLKMDGGKILYLMRDIMLKLGDNYELHIFPGRFRLPDCPVDVFSPKWPINLQIMRDSIFYRNNNVIIHFPFDGKNENKNAYYQYADIGIDFSQFRPRDIISSPANAKLLEYCYYGLKVVAEKNINNSHLVEDGKNGILLENVASVNDYVNAIKKIKDINIDKEYTIKKTIEKNNWDIISLNILNNFKNLK